MDDFLPTGDFFKGFYKYAFVLVFISTVASITFIVAIIYAILSLV